MTDKDIPQKTNISVEVPDNLKAGAYANTVNIAITSNDETIFDFIFVHPTLKTAVVVSRVVIPLKVAKSLNMIMQTQLGKAKKAE